jgi:uncharacterized RDD family membrane protein YckC
MSNSSDFLREEYTIDTPENVTFGYEIAGIGSRFIGAVVDSIILVVSLMLLNIILGVVLSVTGDVESLFLGDENEIGWWSGLVLAIYTLLNFGLIWGYYILFELLWNGQTPGKRVAKVRVVRMDGNPAGFIEIVVRNLVRIIDFLPGAYGIGLVTMFFNRQARRLGDFAAGTLVIKEQPEVGLESLGRGAGSTRPVRIDPVPIGPVPIGGAFDPPGVASAQCPNLHRLSAADIDLVQDALNRYSAGKADGYLLRRLAVALAAKLEMPDPTQDWRRFLNAIAEAYRQAGQG